MKKTHGVAIPEETREAVERDEIPMGMRADMLRAEMKDMKPGSKEHIKAAMKLRDMEKMMRKKRLMKQMRDLDEDEDEMSMMGMM